MDIPRKVLNEDFVDIVATIVAMARMKTIKPVMIWNSGLMKSKVSSPPNRS